MQNSSTFSAVQIRRPVGSRGWLQAVTCLVVAALMTSVVACNSSNIVTQNNSTSTTPTSGSNETPSPGKLGPNVAPLPDDQNVDNDTQQGLDATRQQQEKDQTPRLEQELRLEKVVDQLEAKDAPSSPETQANTEPEQKEIEYAYEVESLYPLDEEPGKEKQTIEIGEQWKRLGKEHEIWIDMKAKQIMIAGHVCLREGPLEVFICPRRTKEHEAVVTVNATALQLHTALIALGANPGHPVKFPFGEQKEYVPAKGPVIKIKIRWRDGEQITEVNGQEFVREFESKKPLKHDWVFGGSEFYEDPHTKQKYYYGDSGEMVCLSNFPTATMDLPIESSQSNEALLYEANPDKVPSLGTKVYLTFEPVVEN